MEYDTITISEDLKNVPRLGWFQKQGHFIIEIEDSPSITDGVSDFRAIVFMFEGNLLELHTPISESLSIPGERQLSYQSLLRDT